MSKRELMLQKGLQLKQLTEETTQSNQPQTNTNRRPSKEVARYKELFPPGTDDEIIANIIKQNKGDAQRIQHVISEMWEDHRGNDQDEWATVTKKGKKKEQGKSQSSWDNNAPTSSAHSMSSRGRGSGRGRGMSSSRGGRGPASRGGRGGRGPIGSQNGPRSGSKPPSKQIPATSGAPTTEETEEVEEENQTTPEKKSHTPVTTAPSVSSPPLAGAWAQKPKITESYAAAASGKLEKPNVQKVASDGEKFSQNKAPEVSKKPTQKSENKNAQQKQENRNENEQQQPRMAWRPIESAQKQEWKNVQEESVPKPSSPVNAWAQRSPIVDVVPKSPNLEKSVFKHSPKESHVNSFPKSPKEINVFPSSPKEANVARLNVPSPKEVQPIGSDSRLSNSASPKQYLKMGRWETAASTELSLQFGSISLNALEPMESSLSNAWSTSNSTSSSSWNSHPTSLSPKNIQKPSDRISSPKSDVSKHVSQEQNLDSHSSSRKTPMSQGSMPPGLSTEPRPISPTNNNTPPSYAPAAPSPASLPNPDDVKRSTRNSTSPFPMQAVSQNQGPKLNISSSNSPRTFNAEYSGKSTSLYQHSYPQYSLTGRNPSSGSSGMISQIGGGLSTQSNKQPATTRSNSGAGSGTTPLSSGPSQLNPTGSQTNQPLTNSLPQQVQVQQPVPQAYHPHYAPPPPPGMAVPYNPYNYANYYQQGYGYYQNHQYPQYSPRQQYPPRANMPYGMDASMQGFSNPTMPIGYQDQHGMPHAHDYATLPQGFGELGGAYQQQSVQGHHQMHQQQNNPQSHTKTQSSTTPQQSLHGQRPMSASQNFPSNTTSSTREPHTTSPPVPNPVGSSTSTSSISPATYGTQQYSWNSYSQPMSSWSHMLPQNGYQAPIHPPQHQQQQPQQQQNTSGNNSGFRQFGSSGGNPSGISTSSNEANTTNSWNA